MTRKQGYCRALSRSHALSQPAAFAGPIENYSPVTDARLQNPEPGNWMLYRRTYDGQGYSPLDQINTSNVKNLTPVWTFSTGVNEGHEAPPIVNNGVMFVATPMGQVIALNAKTGDEYWRYKRQLPDDLFQLHPTSRGVGLWQDKLYLATTDDHVVALDAKTGKVVWDKKVQDYKKGQYMTLMPMVVDGKVVVGGSGGEFGVRGYVVAFDANDGKELWRTFTIPGEGEPGHDTWSGDDWKSGGGSRLDDRHLRQGHQDDLLGHRQCRAVAGRQSPRRQSLYQFGARARSRYRQDQGFPPVSSERFMGLGRGGRADAGRPATGRPLVQEPDPSRTRCDLLGAGAQADAINYVAGWPFVKTDVWKGIEAETGRPIVDPDHKPTLGKRVEFCPSLWGGKDWPSAAYSQKTGLVYVPANDNFCGGFTGEKVPLVPGQLWLGTKPEDIGLSVRAGRRSLSANCRRGIRPPARRSGRTTSPSRSCSVR
jgi:alcohol dehydrogenase (cytochrome c)